jgi:hypothetical protein
MFFKNVVYATSELLATMNNGAFILSQLSRDYLVPITDNNSTKFSITNRETCSKKIPTARGFLSFKRHNYIF